MNDQPIFISVYGDTTRPSKFTVASPKGYLAYKKFPLV
ncbi:hypothetical protein ADIS_1797 [Lunatimonas lonarensis]|uniref:Uncharacterized protein n=1 Tax=Lunatimonas lonarensis TaxID=1232681 RepID=R7ZU51_9BACT|nr:hypothetical protein ADIS_1797 [Lunatimonas lonarensis]